MASQCKSGQSGPSGAITSHSDAVRITSGQKENDLSVSEPHFVLQISQPPGFTQKWFYIHDLYMDLSFQKKKPGWKSISQLLKYVTNNQIKKLYIFFGTPFSWSV